VFGVIEAITPLIGWGLGLAAAGFVEAVDHWIAFVLLSLVGGKMIWEAAKPHTDDDDAASSGRGGLLALVMMAVGTSIDAAAVGVSLAFIGVNIVPVALSIGCATFVMTTIGMTIGRAIGARFGKIAEVVGGIALIGLGIGILVEHLKPFS
jgi:putative Mn2+ efflux pump MntP